MKTTRQEPTREALLAARAFENGLCGLPKKACCFMSVNYLDEYAWCWLYMMSIYPAGSEKARCPACLAE